MNQDSRETTIGALAAAGHLHLQTGPFGSQLHAHDYVPSGTPVIPTEAIGRRTLRTDGLPRVDATTVQRLARHRVQPGDILFARRGVQATGYSALVQEQHAGWLCGTGAILLRITSREIDSVFLSFMLAADSSIEWLKTHAVGAVMPNLNAEIISRLPVTLPSPAEQRAVAEVLGALDDKIELNRRTNETLDTLAQTAYEQWASDVEPDATVYQVEDLIGQQVLVIGDGYRAKNSELATEGLPFARAADVAGTIRASGGDCLIPERVPFAGEKISRPLDVVVTTKGTVGRMAQVAPHTPRFVYSPQLCYWRVRDPDFLDPHVLYRWMRSRAFTDQMHLVAGQTDMAPYVNLRDQRRMTVAVPTPDSQERIKHTLAALHERIASDQTESETLVTLRDTLLPRLLSGELRVRDAEPLVAAAV